MKWMQPKDIVTLVEQRRAWVEDTVIILTGNPGVRKSQLACILAKQHDPNFTYDRNLFYSRTKFVQAIDEFPDGSALIADEAINMLFKREWNKKDQMNITKLFDRCRYKKHLLILCIPNMFGLDRHIRDTRTTLWINIYRKDKTRSFARIWIRENNEALEDPWNRPWMITCIRKNQVFRSVNYAGHLHFNQMKQEEYNAYYKVKVSKNNEEDIKVYDPEDIRKALDLHQTYLVYLFFKAGVLGLTKAAQVLNLPPTTLTGRVSRCEKLVTSNPLLHNYITTAQSKQTKPSILDPTLNRIRKENEQDNNIPIPEPETEPPPPTNLIKYNIREDGKDSRTTIFQTPPKLNP